MTSPTAADQSAIEEALGDDAACVSGGRSDNHQVVPESVGLVPELYYDVIARLSAGAPFVLFMLWGNKNLEHLDGIKLAVLMLLTSYLLGHLLSTFSAVLNWILWRPCFLKLIVGLVPMDNPFSDTSYRSGFHELYKRIDSIAARDSNGGTILKKMEAGAALSDNLLCGYVLLAALKLYRDGWPSWMRLFLGIVVAAVLMLTVVIRRMVLIGRQDTLWSVVVEQDLAKPKYTK